MNTQKVIHHCASGRTEVVSNMIDCIELSFTDTFGNPILSLENFVITLLLNDVKPEKLPKPHHPSLFKTHKGNMQSQRAEAAKKLRSSSEHETRIEQMMFMVRGAKRRTLKKKKGVKHNAPNGMITNPIVSNADLSQNTVQMGPTSQDVEETNKP